MRILVLRFSALGDVALTVPVLQKLKEQYPEVEVTLVSRPFMKALFQPLPLHFHAADVDKDYRGTAGLWKLFRQLKRQYRPDVVVDLHYVLRTRILSTFFKAAGVKVFHVNKGRAAKKRLTRAEDKIRTPLPHTTQRYAEAFGLAGFHLPFEPSENPRINYRSDTDLSAFIPQKDKVVIGVAPFAQHKGKMWPIPKMKSLLQELGEKGYRVLLFGGPDEREQLEELRQSEFIQNTAGTLKLGDELALMKHLKLMIAMDSSNMHMATLTGVPVVSIWGAAHSHAGFGPLGDNIRLKAEIPLETLTCRPCSIYGNKPCLRKDYACLNWLEVKQVLQKVEDALSGQY